MTKQTDRIVSVWLDETSDCDDPQWIVDTDSADGGESDTIRCFAEDGFERAVRFAKRAAKKRGCDLHLLNGVSRIVMPADEIELD